MADERSLRAFGPAADTLTSSDDPRQRLVAGRYEVRRSLGTGASKQVFLAHDLRLDRDVALALIRGTRPRKGLPARVLQEIQTTARLDEHPHIVTVHDVIEQVDAVWIVSQLVRGGTVAALLELNPRGLPSGEAVRIASQVAKALQFAHEHGVIHRDVKPSNVLLVPPHNTALLADFGVAFLPDRPRLTVTDAPVGTALYMSPEQARGDVVTPRSDLYSLGAMLFELLCGQPPFGGDTLAALVTQHLHESPPDPAVVNPGVAPDLARLVLELLSKQPDDRPDSALAVSEVLESLRTGRSPPEQRDVARPRPLLLPGPLIRDPGQVFVGRHTAMASLRQAWDRAGCGPPHLVMLSGEAGIGKTTLAAAFADDVHHAGAVVLYGRCDEDPLVSYQPFVEALRHLVRIRPEVVDEVEPGSGAELRELAKLIPELRRHATATVTAEQEPRTLERYRLFETMLALFAPEASRRRLLLVLDDMQWADEPTELLLRHLMRAPLSGLMVLITRRPPKPRERNPLAKLAEDLRRDAGGHRRLLALTVQGLDAEETYELASSRRENQVDRAFGDLLRAETAGHPFFIDQVLRGLGDADLSTTESAAHALHDLGVPDEVQEFIEYRMASFAPDTEDLLKQAAVCGPKFRLDLLAALRRAAPESVIELLSDPIAAGLVIEQDTDQYSFSHALVRETLYERKLLRSERAHAHLRIGETLERMRSRRVSSAELALHFHAAREIGGAERAVKYALAAAEQTAKALAYEEAAEFMQEACEALEYLGPARDEERCRLLRSLGQLRWRAGDQRGAQHEFLRAADLARELGDSTGFARAALGYAGRSYHAEAIDPVLRRLFDEALATLPDRESSLRAKLLARLAEALHPVDGTRAIELTERALEILEEAPDEDALTTAIAARHTALLHIEHHDERLEVGNRWVQLTEKRGRHSVGTALTWRVYDLIENGDRPDVEMARRVRQRLSELAVQLRQPFYWHFDAALGAKWLLMEGRFEEAAEKAREGYAHGLRAQGSHVALLFAGQRFGLYRDQGRLQELTHDVAPFLDPENETLPVWRAGPMLAHQAAGDIERARSELRAMTKNDFAGVPRDMFWLGLMCMFAEAAAELDDRDVAAEVGPTLAPYARYNAQIGLSVVLGPVHGFLARLAALLGDDSEARRHFQLALGRADILGARPALARIQCHYGEFLLSGGSEAALPEALDVLRRCRYSARELGMAGIDARAGQALAVLQTYPGPTTGGSRC
jgi:eukaryotic-like serine/threonine-protein kinase